MLAFLSGLLAGFLHVLSGPDHLAAVLPWAARSPEKGRAYGAVWGLGHGGGMACWLVVGVSFRSALPLDRISSWAELLVGASLVLVGLFTVRHHAHPEHPTNHPRRAALGLGVLHGTAGAGHLVGALPVLGLSASGGALYCVGFVLAGFAAMTGAGAFMGHVTRKPGFARYARPVCAFFALLTGCAWIAGALIA